VVWLILYLRWQYELKLQQVPIPVHPMIPNGLKALKAPAE
jgi:hypothetical protein